ncbi:cyanophycinase [Agromyces mediolanus]|uniref:cyanophycinase n=1 Tax=Agromyces mediolanus TaxID=41986 RepID=UPI00383360BA
MTASHDASAARGTLVLIGGALDEHRGILEPVVQLAASASPAPGRPPRIAILTTASEPAASADAEATNDPGVENDAADGRYYAALFARHGAEGVPIPVGVAAEPRFPGQRYLAANAEREELAALVRSCDGVFLGGGDQTHYVLALFRSSGAAASAGAPPFGERRDTAVLAAIREVLDRGGVVAGTSAGLAVQQGAGMVSGGGVHESWRLGAEPGYADDERLRSLPAGGLGLFPEALLDSHFSEWGRLPRAIRLARALDRPLVVGVDERTALVYDRAARRGRVIGDRGVHLVEVAESEATDARASHPGSGDAVDGVRWTQLLPGDELDFRTRRIERADPAPLAPGDGAAPPPETDAWAADGSRPLVRLAQRLLASGAPAAHGDTAESTPRYRTVLRRDERTVRTAGGGFDELLVSIAPAPSATTTDTPSPATRTTAVRTTTAVPMNTEEGAPCPHP